MNLGRRYQIPTVALRYSIVQGPRQSVFNAYSGACRIFCLHYRQGSTPTCTRTARRSATTSTLMMSSTRMYSYSRGWGRRHRPQRGRRHIGHHS